MSQDVASTRKKAKRSRYFDYIVSMSAVLISVCAFSVSYYQTQFLKKQTEIMQEQMHASVWPRLFITKNIGNNSLELIVQNDGVGPAIVKSVEFCVDGIPCNDWTDVLSKLIKVKDSLVMERSFINNRTIPQGNQIRMIRITNKEHIKLILDNYNRISLEICYSSIYKKHWKLIDNGQNNKGFPFPESIKQIDIIEERQFLN